MGPSSPHPHHISTTKPIALSWRSHKLFILLTVVLGLFTDTFLYGLVVPVLPFILERRVAVSPHHLQYYSSVILAAYAVCNVVVAPLAGVLADRSSSRRLPFLIGLAISIAGTILFFLGRSVPVLIAARCAQGAGSAVNWTVGFALCLDTVGSNNLGKTIGTMMSFVHFGALVSPPLGGIIYSQVGMLGIAGLGLGILALDLVVRLLLIEKSTAGRYVDKSSFAAASADSASMPNGQPAAYQEERHHQTEEERPLLLRHDVSNKYLVKPTRNRLLTRAPILVCLKDPSLIASSFITVVQASLLGAFDATVTLEARQLFGFGPLQAGLVFAPLVFSRLAGGPIGGWVVDRYGSKTAAVIGNSFLASVLLSFRWVTAEPRSIEVALYCLLLALVGMGMSLVGPAGFVEGGEVVRKYHQRNPGLFGENGPFALMCGMRLMFFGAGLTLGPIVAGVLRDRIGYGNMNAVLGGWAAISATVSFIWLGGKPVIFKKMIKDSDP